MTLKRGQKVNHFLGMLQICRKKSLARHLSNMRRMFPAEYKFFPRAYILPNQLYELTASLNSDRLRTYILKPDNGCQGRGVVLVQSVAELKQAVGGMAGANMLAQKYLANPMLLNGYKFDLRIYVLILSSEPLRLFLYREGIARFCTEKYMKPEKANLKLNCMHLTNYSVNKKNSKFQFNASASETDKGSKWALSSLFKALSARGYDIGRLRRQIRKMVVMTIIAIVPLLVHNYKSCVNEDDNGRSCFELLGMDVLLDDKCRPWLLEVNHSPSFAIDTPLDFKIKEALLRDTLKLVKIDPFGVSKFKLQDKKCAKMRLYGSPQFSEADLETSNPDGDDFKDSYTIAQLFDEYDSENLGNYDRIYPSDDAHLQSLYDLFLVGSEEAFKQSFDMKVKNAILKAQEERKREEMEKEAAEKRKQKKRAEMRKKAQESARLAAALAQKRASSATNRKDSNENDLNALQKGFVSEMDSPLSNLESPTGWELTQMTLEREANKANMGQIEELNDISNSVIDHQGKAFDETNIYCTSEIMSRKMARVPMVGCGSSSAPQVRKAPDYMNYPYHIESGMPRLTSLPCIVPQAFSRQQLTRQSFLRTSPAKDTKLELDGESLLIKSNYIRKTPETRYTNLPDRRNSTFQEMRRWCGRLPQLKQGLPVPYDPQIESFLQDSKPGMRKYPATHHHYEAPAQDVDTHRSLSKGLKGTQISSALGHVYAHKDIKSASGLTHPSNKGGSFSSLYFKTSIPLS